MIDDYLGRHIQEISTICKQYKIAKLYAFGSIVDGRFVPDKSDIDLLVEFDLSFTKKELSRTLLLLWMELQRILGCKVDLITSDQIEGKYFRKYLDLYKELIYPITT